MPTSSPSPVDGYEPLEDETSGNAPRRPGWLRFVMFNVIVPCGILLLGGLAWWTMGEQQAAVRPADDQSLAARLQRIPAVETLPVHSLAAVGGQLDLEVDGVVVPYREIQIATEVAGKVIFKAPQCEAGTYVEKGQLLIRIDPSDYQNEIDRLTQLKEQEYQSIRELEQQLINVDRLLEVAEQDVELQEREIARLEKLPAGFASAAEMDQAQQSRLQAINSRITLQNEADLMRRRRVRLEAAEQLVEVQLRLAEANLARTEIRSPVAGVIYREDAELNSFVQRGAVIVTIEDTSRAEVAVNLRTDQLYWVLDQVRQEEADLVPPVAGQGRSYALPPTAASILYKVAGRENEVYRWDATLERYDGIGFDTVSRTVPVRLVVEQPRRYQVGGGNAAPAGSPSQIASTGPSALVRGMFVSVVLHVEPRRPLVVVPAVGLKPGNRVWKFVADPSVIAGEATTAEPDPETADAVAPAVEPESEFHPENWVAGRLVVLEQLRPIQAADLIAEVQGERKFADSQEGRADYWVCEVGQGELSAGNRIIVSPLPSFEGTGSDIVRVPAPQVQVATKEVPDRTSNRWVDLRSGNRPHRETE